MIRLCSTLCQIPRHRLQQEFRAFRPGCAGIFPLRIGVFQRRSFLAGQHSQKYFLQKSPFFAALIASLAVVGDESDYHSKSFQIGEAGRD